MLTLRATADHVVLHLCMCNESNVFIFFNFLWGCYGGALVFLGGAGAPASPSLAPPMPKGILGWASGAKSSERRSPLQRKYDRSAPAPLRSCSDRGWTPLCAIQRARLWMHYIYSASKCDCLLTLKLVWLYFFLWKTKEDIWIMFVCQLSLSKL